MARILVKKPEISGQKPPCSDALVNDLCDEQSAIRLPARQGPRGFVTGTRQSPKD
jgi:hypothetical protein